VYNERNDKLVKWEIREELESSGKWKSTEKSLVAGVLVEKFVEFPMR
jgi:hypothetical protein